MYIMCTTLDVDNVYAIYVVLVYAILRERRGFGRGGSWSLLDERYGVDVGVGLLSAH